MLTVYCDASVKKADEVISLWGYVAPAEKWESFDRSWKSVLGEFGVEYFHMKEFAHSNGPYKPWKGRENKRRDFLSKLIAVIGANVSYGVGASVPMGMYNEADTAYQISEHMHPYALCGAICIDFILKWQDVHHLKNEPLEFVFEAGDEGRGHLIHWTKELTDREPTFKRMKEATPLQAADFAVYEEYRGVKKGEIDDLDRIVDGFRESGVQLLDAVPQGGGVLKRGMDVEGKMQRLKYPREGFLIF